MIIFQWIVEILRWLRYGWYARKFFIRRPPQRVVPLFPWSTSVPPEAKLVAGPIIGYRVWTVRDGLLQSWSYGFTWMPGVVTRAYCDKSHALPIPGWGCVCGLYFYREILEAEMVPDGLRSPVYGFSVVHGKVLGWGTVIKAEHGYKVEYAYPLAFFAPRPLSPETSQVGNHSLVDTRLTALTRLAEYYHVPIISYEEEAYANRERSGILDSRTAGMAEGDPPHTSF